MIPVLIAFTTLLSSPQTSVRGYDFPLGSENKFNVNVAFEGYIPLFGGKVGKANVDFVVSAKSVPEKSPLLTAVESEIVELKAVAFGATLPLNKNNIGQFFPKATATFDATGLVKFNSAEAVNMPVKLPGLDSQRLPEISYVPLIVNSDALTSGTSYEFDRTFNGAAIHYKVTPSKAEDGHQTLAIEVSQDSEGFEDAYGNPAEASAAKFKLKTHLTGTGSAVYNPGKAMFDKVVVETNAETDVTNMKTSKETKRNLKTTLTIIRDGVKTELK